MIKLYEFQTKEILRAQGIKVPNGSVWSHDRPLKRPELTGSAGWVLKAQVAVSSRFKKGLVVFTEDKKISSTQLHDILSKARRHAPCEHLLLEENIPHDQEVFLAILSDPVTRAPLIILHPQGGIEVEKTLSLSRISGLAQPVDILKGFDESNFRKLAQKARISQERITSLAYIAKKLYAVYREWDCSFVEINPLAWTNRGWVALDAKAELDEDANFRIEKKARERGVHLVTRSPRTPLEEQASKIDEKDYRGSAHFVQNDMRLAKKRFGKKIKAVIGFNGVGTGASLTAMDELVRVGFFPRNFCDTSGNPPASKLYRATRIILSQPGIKGYFFISCVSSQQLDNTARGILKAFKEKYAKTNGLPTLPSLFHFRGAWDEEAKELFKEHGFLRSQKVIVLGRESSERDAAKAFARLYAK